MTIKLMQYLSARRTFVTAAVICTLATAPLGTASDLGALGLTLPDASGLITTVGPIDPNNAFFKSLGTNGRSCFSCHQPDQGWSIAPLQLQLRFALTLGRDPVFNSFDGTNCDTADQSNLSRRKASSSLLLQRGLIRIALDVPANAEFTVLSAQNPYGCSSTSTLSMYRRPLPSTNVNFLTTVMWDGRESFTGNTLQQNLAHQANDAVTGHAQGANISATLQQQIVDFEMGLHTAQSLDFAAGLLATGGANGGANALAQQPFTVGVNDPLNPPFTPSAFDIFQSWANVPNWEAARKSIARGEVIFNTKPITITGVAGLNTLPGLSTVNGTCTTCHNSPNIGNHSVPLAIDIGLSAENRHTPDMPLFTLQNKTTLEVVKTMDPGRAMVTGKWADISKTKGPILRGLAGRAPYFHNGSAAKLEDVVDFYTTRFGLTFTPQDKTDLVNFLHSL